MAAIQIYMPMYPWMRWSKRFSHLRQPLQTTLDRPEIGLPATDVVAGYAEGIPFAYVVSKPIKQFLRGLKTKLITP